MWLLAVETRVDIRAWNLPREAFLLCLMGAKWSKASLETVRLFRVCLSRLFFRRLDLSNAAMESPQVFVQPTTQELPPSLTRGVASTVFLPTTHPSRACLLSCLCLFAVGCVWGERGRAEPAAARGANGGEEV